MEASHLLAGQSWAPLKFPAPQSPVGWQKPQEKQWKQYLWNFGGQEARVQGWHLNENESTDQLSAVAQVHITGLRRWGGAVPIQEWDSSGVFAQRLVPHWKKREDSQLDLRSSSPVSALTLEGREHSLVLYFCKNDFLRASLVVPSVICLQGTRGALFSCETFSWKWKPCVLASVEASFDLLLHLCLAFPL